MSSSRPPLYLIKVSIPQLLCIQDLLLNPFLVIYKDKEGIISNPTDFPDVSDIGVRVKSIQEPVVNASIIVPEGMSFALIHIQKINDEPLTLRVFWWHDGTLLLPSRWRSRTSLPRLRNNLGQDHIDLRSSSQRNRYRLLWSTKKPQFRICQLRVSIDISVFTFQKWFSVFSYEDAGYRQSDLAKVDQIYLLRVYFHWFF